MGAMRIALTSFDSLRISISAMPGITCGTLTVTNNLYGPALPSTKTSGLPTCAQAGRPDAAIATRYAKKRFITSAADCPHPLSRRRTEPAAQDRQKHGFGHDHPESECGVVNGHKEVPDVISIGRREIGEILGTEKPIRGSRRNEKNRERPLHGKESGQENHPKYSTFRPLLPSCRSWLEQV